MKRDRLNYLTNFSESKFDKYLYATYPHIFQEKDITYKIAFYITIIEEILSNCLNTQTMDKSHIFQ